MEDSQSGMNTEDPGTEVTSTRSMILDAPPSCIEFSWIRPDVFVVGTYSLRESNGAENGSQSRGGSLLLLRRCSSHVYVTHNVRSLYIA